MIGTSIIVLILVLFSASLFTVVSFVFLALTTGTCLNAKYLRSCYYKCVIFGFLLSVLSFGAITYLDRVEQSMAIEQENH